VLFLWVLLLLLPLLLLLLLLRLSVVSIRWHVAFNVFL
jgi:hypothetical protein